MENQNLSSINSNTSVVTTGDWMVTILITIIPIVNIVMLFVWAFGSGSNPSKANWAKASLIWFAIVIGVYFMLAVMFGAALLANM